MRPARCRAPALRRVTVAPYRTVADELFQLAFGRRAVVASDEQVEDVVAKAAESVGAKGQLDNREVVTGSRRQLA